MDLAFAADRSDAPITLDLTRPRAIFVTGKRGSGKTTTLHTVASLAVEQGVRVVAVDPLGAVRRLAPGAHCLAPGQNLRLNPSDLSTDAWLGLFGYRLSEPGGICLSRAIRRAPDRYTIAALIRQVELDDRSADTTRDAVVNRLEAAAEEWSIFHRDGYHPLPDALAHGLNVVDLSGLEPGPHSLRNLATSLLISRLFARAQTTKPETPLLLAADEAHNLTARGALASKRLKRWTLEGRNFNLSVALATQRPSALPGDLISQADVIVIHRLTMLDDVKAVSRLASTYARDLGAILKGVREPGQAVIVDDARERATVGKVIQRSYHDNETRQESSFRAERSGVEESPYVRQQEISRLPSVARNDGKSEISM